MGLFDLGTTDANGLAFAVNALVAKPLLSAWKVAPQPEPLADCSSAGQTQLVQPAPATTSAPSGVAIYNGAHFSINRSPTRRYAPAVTGSWFKRAHRTHGFDQPAGTSYPHLVAGQADGGHNADTQARALFAELVSRVPDPVKRAELLGVAPELEEAWQRGAALPVLRAHRKALERALR